MTPTPPRRTNPPRPKTEVIQHRILASLSGEFAKCYSLIGRPSVPPERLLKAKLLLALYTFRSERQLCERIDLLFRRDLIRLRKSWQTPILGGNL